MAAKAPLMMVGVFVAALLLVRVPQLCSAAKALTTTFDVEVDSAGYAGFMAAFDKNVNATAKATSRDWIDQHPILGDQKLWQEPAFWLEVVLKDTKGQNMVTLVLRSDNLYLCGFKNNHGEWFNFDGYDYPKTFPHRSTPLGFGSGYPDLFGRRVGYAGMGQVGVNKAQAFQHLVALSSHRAAARTHDAMKLPLAFYILVVCEAERFQPIKAAVSQAATIKLLVQWKRTSCALLAWAKYGRSEQTWRVNTEAQEIQSVGIKTPQQALSIINAILKGVGCSMKH